MKTKQLSPQDKLFLVAFVSLNVFACACALRMTQNIPSQYHPTIFWTATALQVASSVSLFVALYRVWRIRRATN